MRRIALLALACVMACGSDDEPTNPGGAGGGTLTATVGGVAFSGSLAVQAVRTSSTITISGVSSSQQQLSINLLGVNSTGTVSIGAGSQNFAQFSQGTQTWVSSLVGGTGTLTLTTLTASRAAGTFSFTGIPSASTGATGNKAVTNGTFDVSF